MAGRPERPLDPSVGPVARFAAGLRELRAEAGSPTYRVPARRAGQGASTLSQSAAGERLPTLPVVLAYLRACGGDEAEWEKRWHKAATEAAAEPRTEDGDAAGPYRGLARFEPTTPICSSAAVSSPTACSNSPAPAGSPRCSARRSAVSPAAAHHSGRRYTGHAPPRDPRRTRRDRPRRCRDRPGTAGPGTADHTGPRHRRPRPRGAHHPLGTGCRPLPYPGRSPPRRISSAEPICRLRCRTSDWRPSSTSRRTGCAGPHARTRVC